MKNTLSHSSVLSTAELFWESFYCGNRNRSENTFLDADENSQCCIADGITCMVQLRHCVHSAEFRQQLASAVQCSPVSAAAESAEITTTLMTTCGLDTRINA